LEMALRWRSGMMDDLNNGLVLLLCAGSTWYYMSCGLNRCLRWILLCLVRVFRFPLGRDQRLWLQEDEWWLNDTNEHTHQHWHCFWHSSQPTLRESAGPTFLLPSVVPVDYERDHCQQRCHMRKAEDPVGPAFYLFSRSVLDPTITHGMSAVPRKSMILS
jgi:hypothetical protein